MGLSSNLIASILDPFLGHENLLGDLHKNNKRIIYNIYIYNDYDNNKLRHFLASNSKRQKYAYHGEVSLRRHKQVRLPHVPKSLHILREEERLL